MIGSAGTPGLEPIMLSGIDEGLLFLIAIVAFLVALEIAYRLGRRRSDRSDAALKSHVDGLRSALLGLLSLLLGFNFAMAVARFETRKALLQEEMNSIRTTFLRAQLLPSAERQEVTERLKGYVADRVAFQSGPMNDATIQAAIASAARFESGLWSVAARITAQGLSGAPTGLFVQSVNDLIVVNGKRRASLDNHVPEIVLHLLFTVALFALSFMAYAYGLTGRPRHGSTVIFALLIAVVLAIIVDLDRPRRGLIRINEDGMIRLQQILDGDS